MSDPMTPDVRDWMKRTDVEPPDAHESARRVRARLPGVRQRRRWWPFPVFYRKPETPPTEHPTPIPASNGHTPTVIGRTQSMLSPAKAITAGTIVFAIGGVMLVAQPFQQQSSVPGAATADEPLEAQFTAIVLEADRVEDGRIMPADNPQFTAPFEATDPRFSGFLTTGFADHTFWDEDRPGWFGSVEAMTVRLVTDQGEWSGTGTRTWAEGVDGFSNNGMFTLAGAGDEEGLTLLLSERWDEEPETFYYSGTVIDTAEMPRAPDLLPAE